MSADTIHTDERGTGAGGVQGRATLLSKAKCKGVLASSSDCLWLIRYNGIGKTTMMRNLCLKFFLIFHCLLRCKAS